MSNAMRSGKRMLAGAAAGALAAGFMTFVAMPSAQAGVATTLELEFPSVTVISAANTTAIPVDIGVLDVSGDDATSLPSNTSIRVSVTKPAAATAQTDDTFIGIVMSTDDTLTVDDTTAYEDVTFKIGGASDKGTTDVAMPWASATTAGYVGTYTITACLYNSASGACSSTQTMDFTLVASGGAPAATVNFLNTTYYNPLSALGVSADDSVQVAPTFQLAVTDAKGGPYVMDAGNVDFAVSSGTTLGTLTQATGYGAAVLGTYSVSASGVSDWGSAGTRTLTATATPNGSVVSGTGSLPVYVASVNETPAGISAELTNTVAYRPDSDDDTWQVPPGTTTLEFGVSTNDAINAPNTLAWNTQLTDAAGAASPSGGATAIDASSGAVTVNLNAAAAGVGETAYFVAGSYQPSALGDDSIARIEVQFVAPAVTVTGTNGLAKVGTATTIPGTVLDQYGATVPGTYTVKAYVGTVACSTSATPAATATADASGNFSVTIPADQVPATPTTGQVYSLCASNGFDTPTRGLATWTYTATGGVTSLTLSSSPSNTSTVYPLVRVPAAGVVDLNTATSATIAYNASAQTIATAVNSTATVARTAVSLTAAVSPVGVPVTFSSDTALFTDKTSGTIYTTAGANSVTVVSDGSGNASAEVFATTSGTHTVTVSAGETSTTMKFTASPAAGSGRQIAISPASKSIAPDSFHTFTATVTDLYGNAVPDDTAAITLALNGGGTINPAAGTRGTSLTGTLNVTYTAPAGTGTAQIVVAGNNFQTGTIPFGAALVDEAKADITVTSGPDPSEKTIVIVGERGTVKGKSGVIFDGATTGFDQGTKMKPWIRFPGQSSYEAGSARPTTSSIGDFTWQRKTGKKIYVYFTNEDGDIKSNRVIVAAK